MADLKSKVNQCSGKILVVFLSIMLILIIAAGVGAYMYLNKIKEENKDVIISGVTIKGFDVAGLNKEDAIKQVENCLKENFSEHIILRYSNEEYYVELEQFDAHFDIETAVDEAYRYGKNSNLIENYNEIKKIEANPVDIDMKLLYDKDALYLYLEGLQAELPDQLEQSSYYLDGNNLIITAGSNGATICKDKVENLVISDIQKMKFNNSVYEMPTETVYPDKINVDAIHEDIYQEMENAHFTTDPYMFYADRIGRDFNVEDVENFIAENPDSTEYNIELEITKPEITVNDIGKEAFPDLLGTFSTKYTNNANRTTNLRLAAGKINSTVIMPGEIFSFNKIVGKRTAAAGYKNAAIFVNGQVEDGLAGGICQISTTLYNAVTFANLEVTERRNHSLLASYAEPGRDATVVWGSSDLKFENTRNYPIKIYFSVDDGYAKCSIYGLKTDNEYNISFETVTVKRTSTTMIVDTYKVYKQNGEVVKKEKLHRDTYKV